MPRPKSAKHEVRVTASAEADRAVRDYLATIGTPNGQSRRARPKPDFERATLGIADPLARLEAIKAERERVANLAAGESEEAAFVKYAKTWAGVHAFDREDFAVLGVPRRVVTAAFGAASDRSGAGASARRRRRSPRTDTKALAEAIAAKAPGSWVSVAGVVDELGGSPATVRKILDQLSAAGTLTRPIADPNHASRGRAPKLWQLN